MTEGISRLAAVGLVALATPILAHHAVQLEFDVSGNGQDLVWRSERKLS